MSVCALCVRSEHLCVLCVCVRVLQCDLGVVCTCLCASIYVCLVYVFGRCVFVEVSVKVSFSFFFVHYAPCFFHKITKLLAENEKIKSKAEEPSAQESLRAEKERLEEELKEKESELHATKEELYKNLVRNSIATAEEQRNTVAFFSPW